MRQRISTWLTILIGVITVIFSFIFAVLQSR